MERDSGYAKELLKFSELLNPKRLTIVMILWKNPKVQSAEIRKLLNIS